MMALFVTTIKLITGEIASNINFQTLSGKINRRSELHATIFVW